MGWSIKRWWTSLPVGERLSFSPSTDPSWKISSHITDDRREWTQTNVILVHVELYASPHANACQRISPQVVTQHMGQVPIARLLPSFANERVSVEYAGTLTLMIGTTRRPTYCKAYVAIFVCLVTESCHIELTSNLTTEAPLAAPRRFVSRRGRPVKIWSDNASYFHRAKKESKELEQCL